MLKDPNAVGPAAPLVPVYALGAPESHLTAVIKVRLNGYLYKALVDTGASICLVSKRVIDTVGYTRRYLQPTDVKATSISGHEFHLQGIAFFKMQIGKRVIEKRDSISLRDFLLM